MKFLNKLKSDRQNLINNLLENIESLEKLAFEQRAEIEQRKEDANKYQTLWCEAVTDIQTAKSEAIKEFAEQYEKALLPLLTSSTLEKNEVVYFCLDMLKEMVGDDNG